MLILGLTGSIGMGKSVAADRFRSRGIAVFDADAEVHRLYREKAVPLIEAAFPGTTNAEGVDRTRLTEALGGNADNFEKLEAIVHPLVLEAQRKFLQTEHARGAKLVVLEIPLLFETGGVDKVDAVIVVSATEAQQRERVLARPGMSEEKLARILARQTPDEEKRARADYVVDTSGSIEQTEDQIDIIIDSHPGVRAWVYEAWWRENAS